MKCFELKKKPEAFSDLGHTNLKLWCEVSYCRLETMWMGMQCWH